MDSNLKSCYCVQKVWHLHGLSIKEHKFFYCKLSHGHSITEELLSSRTLYGLLQLVALLGYTHQVQPI